MRPMRDAIHPRILGRDRSVIVSALLAFALLSMPVSYRAGTDFSHPHSFLTFLADAATGSMAHHRREPAPTPHAQHAHEKVERPRFLASAPPGVPTLDQLGPTTERASAIGLVLLAAIVAIESTRAAFSARRGGLTGLSVRPPTPPPRWPRLLT